MFKWLRRRQQAERLAQADAETLIRDHDGGASLRCTAPINGEYDDQLLGKMPPADRSLHETKHSDRMHDP